MRDESLFVTPEGQSPERSDLPTAQVDTLRQLVARRVGGRIVLDRRTEIEQAPITERAQHIIFSPQSSHLGEADAGRRLGEALLVGGSK